ncbi:MAG: HIT family protein [Candidatus Lokiarchaeota archaeon]|nr:HIT family protein [Candidatus Lokiarchaeota archaeon]
MEEKNCLFCKIISGEIPSLKVYEDENSLAFLDISPFTKGHSIVVPKNHYISLLEFPEEKMQECLSAVKKVAIKLKTKLEADGINIMQNNYKAAGQEINHLHFHVIPRWKNDKAFPLRIEKKERSKEELSEILKKINTS